MRSWGHRKWKGTLDPFLRSGTWDLLYHQEGIRKVSGKRSWVTRAFLHQNQVSTSFFYAFVYAFVAHPPSSSILNFFTSYCPLVLTHCVKTGRFPPLNHPRRNPLEGQSVFLSIHRPVHALFSDRLCGGPALPPRQGSSRQGLQLGSHAGIELLDHIADLGGIKRGMNANPERLVHDPVARLQLAANPVLGAPIGRLPDEVP